MSLPKTILVPTDFGAPAERALDYAFELANGLGATVHLLHVYDFAPIPDGLSPSSIEEVERAANEGLDAAAARHQGSPHLGKVMLHMGEPRDVICRMAKELPADLLVMGTRGRRGVLRVLLGSVTEAVLRVASCPVLVVRDGDAEA